MSKSSFSDLWSACTDGDMDRVRQLVSEHGSAILREKDSVSAGMAIHAAAFNGQLEIVQFLIESGSPLDERSHLGTPLHEACMSGQVDVILYLLDKGADINGNNDLGSPLISLLKELAYTEAALHFIEKGADLTKKDGNDMTVMDWALFNDDVEVFKALVAKGLVPEGVLPLDYAMTHENPTYRKIPMIVRACLADPALGGEVTDERLQKLMEWAKSPETVAAILSERTEREMRAAMDNDAEPAGAPRTRRNATPSL